MKMPSAAFMAATVGAIILICTKNMMWALFSWVICLIVLQEPKKPQ